MCLNYPQTIPHFQSVEKLSSTKPVPGAKKVGDCWKNKSKAGVRGGRQLELKASVNGLRWSSLEPCCCSVIKSCPTLCDPMDCSSPGLPALTISQSFLKFKCIVSDAIEPSCPPLPPSPPTPNLSFLASGSFPMSWLFASGGQSIGASTSASVLPMNIQGSFLEDGLAWSPCSPKDCQESSPRPQSESINSSMQLSL